MVSEKAKTIGVLLTAVGGPDSLDEVAPFLVDIRGGRPATPELVAEFRERYAKIGGRSPLLDISRAQAQALEERLNRDGGSFRCYVGMRNWTPRIRDVYAQMVSDGLKRIVVLPLTPYHSRRSVGAYFRAVQEAEAKVGATEDLTYVESWNTEPALIEAFAAKTREGLARLAAKGHRDPVVLFTAHSLPKKLMEEGDDYEKELQETMARILKQLPPVRSGMAWQSAGRTPEPWLGPPLDDVLEDLAKVGEEAVLIVPFGFISDHLELLYDLDIEAKEIAQRLGMAFDRAESLNTDPKFVDAMASAIRRASD
jgi:ferrochelatase